MDYQLPKHARTPASSPLHKGEKRELLSPAIPYFFDKESELKERFKTNQLSIVRYQQAFEKAPECHCEESRKCGTTKQSEN